VKSARSESRTVEPAEGFGGDGGPADAELNGTENSVESNDLPE
jgi:hypothetical protein